LVFLKNNVSVFIVVLVIGGNRITFLIGEEHVIVPAADHVS